MPSASTGSKLGLFFRKGGFVFFWFLKKGLGFWVFFGAPKTGLGFWVVFFLGGVLVKGYYRGSSSGTRVLFFLGVPAKGYYRGSSSPTSFFFGGFLQKVFLLQERGFCFVVGFL